MSTIVTRAGKGSPLTHTEVDSNFTNLNTDKLEKTNNLSDLTSASTARTNLGLGSIATVAAPAGTVVGTSDTQTLTNKTISADNNTISGIATSSFVLSNGSGNIDGSAAQKAIPTGVVVGTTDTQTLTNKTIDGASNTLTNLPIANITEPVRHSVRPSLLLDFANTKTLDPRITFTRASTGTFYDGKTVAKAEENLLTFSQEFDNAAWTTEAVTKTANSTTAPDGTSTAETLADNATTAVHQTRNATGVSIPNVPVTCSVYMKNNTRQYGCLSIYDGSTYHGVVVDLTNGTITQTNGTITSSSVVDAGNGWYRVVITKTVNTSTFLSVSTSNSGTPASLNLNRPSYSGDGSSIYIWGAQVEQRSSVTAYTATTTAPITNYIPALQTAASGVARFEHNPVTGESLGLEIEEQRTNLLTYSEDFSNWSNINGSTSTNVIVAPDGTLTGDKFVANSTNGQHRVEKTISLTSGTAYTFSVYAKAAESKVISLRTANDSVEGRFALDSGVIQSISGGTASIVSVGNGWYRCSVTGTATSTGSSYNRINIYGASNELNYSGNDWLGAYFWGAQLEAGSFATSYIPTVASQVTRSADAASMTGTNFSSWYRADEGTLYGAGQLATTVQAGQRLFAYLYQATNNNGMGTGFSATTFNGIVVDGSVQANISGGSYSITAEQKASFAFKANDFSLAANGTSIGTDTSGTLPIVDTLAIGRYTPAGNIMNGTIKKIAYYGKRLSNAELVGLTTI